MELNSQTDMASEKAGNTDHRESIFRPWSKRNLANQTWHKTRHAEIDGSSNNLALDLSQYTENNIGKLKADQHEWQERPIDFTRSSPVQDLGKTECQSPNPISPSSLKRNGSTIIGSTMYTAGTPDSKVEIYNPVPNREIWNPALLHRLQVQTYLHNLHLQLLSMRNFACGSATIQRVHQQALVNAQLQHAQSHMAKSNPAAKATFPLNFKYPVPNGQLITTPASPVNMINCNSVESAIQKNNCNSYPLPAAKDGEPLDLLPKSLYLNKSQGGHLCIYCGKVYSRKYGLKIHLRTHTGYKPLKCKVCARPFGDPSNLNKHIRLHAEGDTPYRCEYCGKVLVRRRDLERHIKSRHPEKEKHLPATECDTDGSDGNDAVSDLYAKQELSKIEELDVVG